MRVSHFIAAAALFTVALPVAEAVAKPGFAAKLAGKGRKGKKKKKGKKGKKGLKGGGSSNSSSNSGSSGSSDDTCELPPGVTSVVKGAGQRLSFTFAGKMWEQAGGPKGAFFLSFHPTAPAGDIVHVTCRYQQFSDVNITPAQSRFRMSGKCRQLFADGSNQVVDAVNDVIINNMETDSLSIAFVGDSGIAVPAGALSFGNFAMNAADAS